jgi:hypothetical protein
MSEKLILTEDIILDRLKEKGIEEPGYIDKSSIVDIITKHYGCTIKTGDWPSYADYWFYCSSTADSYEVYVAAGHDKNPDLYSEVYYYENGWLDELEERLVNGDTVYLDGTAEESYEYEEILEKVYEDYWNDKKEEVESELIDEGYEEE